MPQKFEEFKMFVKGKEKLIFTVAVSLLAIIAVVIGLIVSQSGNVRKSEKKVYDPELARAMSYEEFNPGDENITGTDNVKFSAFFLRDLDGDGYAEKLKGTCKEIGKEDTLYMELNVQTAGILKNAKIEINGQNFYLQTALPKDEQLKENYIGNNVKQIAFNDIGNGTQKLLTGIVRCGDYSYASSKTAAIGSNINNYSRDDNKIILTGTYVAEDETEIEIRKEIDLTMDWYGSTSATISAGVSTYYDLEDRIDEENARLNLNVNINTSDSKNQLNISKNYVEGTIPQLNGYDALEVKLVTTNADFTYDEATKIFTIARIAETDENGNITKKISNSNAYSIEIAYPLDAYTSTGENTVTIKVPVKTYYEGYNNANTEFTNPYKSNVAKATLVQNFSRTRETVANFTVTVGKYVSSPASRYVVSKQKPIKIYNGISSEEKDDIYQVKWYAYTGTDGESSGLILKETKDGTQRVSDKFIKTDASEESMENVTTSIGIAFSGASDMLEDDGWINVYDDETDNVLVTFTKKDWDRYTQNNPYEYKFPVKHIRVETSNTKKDSSITVYNIKELDDEYITANYVKADFDNLEYIKSELVGYLGETYIKTAEHQAKYEAPYSVATIGINKNTISTQLTEKNAQIIINANQNLNANQVGWVDGSFLVKLPDEILIAQINGVTISNDVVSVTSYELLENENGKFIKINTKNNSEEPQAFNIKINVELTPDPRIETVNSEIELYASNEEGVEYYYSDVDRYDVNENLNTDELVNKATVSISLIAPNSLLTNQTLSNFDNNGTLVVSPEIADVKPLYAKVDNEEREATIGIQVKNNYASTISDVVILGKIPFEGNSYAIRGDDLGSTFTVKMKNTGIAIPEELQEKVVVYYSEKEKPSKDLSDEANGWKVADEIIDWDNVKTFLIDFQDNYIEKGKEYVFYYTVSIPNGLEFNKVAYSHHGVFFSLDTEEGKYKTQTEPNKIGIRIAEKYNLELTKYQTGKEKLIPGATYKVTEIKEDGSFGEARTATTNEEGKLLINKLYAERAYAIEEIKTPNDYELNSDVVKIIGHVDENGVLTIEKLAGTIREELEVIKNESEEYRVNVKVEDETKAKLKIIKKEQGTENLLKGIRYKVTGASLPESGKIIATNINGEAEIGGLKINEEYTILETKAEGYYLASPIKFKVINNSGTYSIEILEGTTKAANIAEEKNIPTVSLTVEDERIPTYDLEISKIKKRTEVTAGEEGTQELEKIIYLQGAKFRLYKDGKEVGEYITDENGKLIINNLYQYVDAKNLEQTYVLKEILAPDGYAKVKDITFKVQEIDGNLQFISEDGKEREFTSEGNTLKLILEDNPSFKLVKRDGETGELLANIKFAIYNVDNGEIPATNSKGEILGTKEIINGREYYTVLTDNNGELTLDLPEGYYKAVEVQAPEKYDIEKSVYYFGIGGAREGKKALQAEWAIKEEREFGNIIGLYLRFYDVADASDGGCVVVGGFYYGNSSIQIGDITIVNQGDEDGLIVKYDSKGDVEWAQGIGGSSYDRIYSVMETRDGDYIVFGRFSSESIQIGDQILTNNGEASEVIIKYDINGNVEWVQQISETEEYSSDIYSVVETSDRGYIALGGFSSESIQIGDQILTNNGELDGLIIKYDINGKVEWAKAIGGDSYEEFRSISETSDGGCIVGGKFSSSSIQIGDITLESNGNQDGIIIKYDARGNVEWAQQIKTDDAILEIFSVTETIDGGCVVGGWFYRGSIQIGDITLTNAGTSTNDGMVIKYDSEGNVEWAHAIGGDDYVSIFKVAGTSDGGCIVGGKFSSSSIQIGDITITNNNNEEEGLIIKYDARGNVEWAHGIGGTSYDYIILVDQTRDGGIICVDSTFMIKYDSDGNIEWVQKLGESGYSSITSVVETRDRGYIALGGLCYSDSIQMEDIVVDLIRFSEIDVPQIQAKQTQVIEADGDVSITSAIETRDGGYIECGYFNGTAQIKDKTITSKGLCDGIIIKYDSEENVEWIQTIEGDYSDYIRSMSETNDGGYIVVGDFTSDDIKIGDITLESNGNQDGIIIKYDIDGNVEWIQAVAGRSDVSICSTTQTNDDGYIVVGYFYGIDIQIGDITLANANADGKKNGVIIKYDRSGNVEWARRIAGNGDISINSAVETTDGGYIVGGKFAGNISVGGKLLSSKGYYDGIVIKYDRSGNVEWTKTIMTDNEACIKSVSETSDGGCIVGGAFFGDSIKAGNTTLASKGDLDGIIIKYDRYGNEEWIENIGGSGEDGIYSVKESGKENYIVGGYFYSSSIQIGDVTLKNNNTSYSNGMVVRLVTQIGAQEVQTLEVENTRKEFKITTDIEEVAGIEGGTISGQGQNSYERVKYGDSNIKEIKMIPNEGYEIIGITVNGEDYSFKEAEDGSYTMPVFTDVQEDKHIVVKFSSKDNKITINKVDSDTKEPLAGAKFKLDQLEERAEPEAELGELTANGTTTIVLDTNQQVTDVLGEIVNNGTYYFVEEDGKYVPTNSKTYQVANGGTAGKANTTANSYMTIDLTEKTGEYMVVINARNSSEVYNDCGYATITGNTAAPTYSSATGRFMNISGDVSEKDYVSAVLEGGKIYYLHLGYRKNVTLDRNEDRVIINSIGVYGTKEITYNFEKIDGKYESNNQGKDSTVANSYIPIDLTNCIGKYNVTVNAEVSSQSNYDYGYVTITEKTTRPSYSSSTGRFIYISGEVGAKDYTTVLEGGKMYYLHFGYYKNSSIDSGEDKFTINNIKLELNKSELYCTEVDANSEGKAITQVPFGKYEVKELIAPEEYWKEEEPIIIEFRADGPHEFTIENEKKAKVVVHHYIRGTNIKVAEDEIITDGRIGEEYTTVPHAGLAKYELEKDENGEFVLPKNASGNFAKEETEVIYYYVEKEIPLTVHHYIEGTQIPVPLSDGSDAADEAYSDKEGENYTTKAISDDELDLRYELVEIPENATGTYQGEEIIVTYYYKEVERNVTLNKYQEDGKTPLEGAKFTIEEVDNSSEVDENVDTESENAEDSKVQMELTTDSKGRIQTILNAGEYVVTEVEAPEGYQLPEEPSQNITVSRASADIVINLNNDKKQGTVTVHHYIEGTTTPVPLQDGSSAQDEIKTGEVGDIYATKAVDNLSNKYELTEVSDNASGEYIDGNIDVIYYYRVIPAQVVVHYYEENTTTSLSPDVTIDGFVGDEYKTVVGEKVPEYYELVAEPENKAGIMTKEPIEVIYYYKLKMYSYVVNYLEKDNEENILIPQKQGDALEYGSEVIAEEEVIEIDGYDFDSVDKDTLTIGTEENVINIYYTLKDTSVLVHHYIEGTTTSLSDDVVIEGKVFETYETEVATDMPSKYELVAVPENAQGEMTEEQIVVTYYYRTKPTQVIVHHYEEGTTNKLSETVTIDGRIDDEYTTTAATDIPVKYELVAEPENASGIMTEEPIEVTYYYGVKDASLVIKYVEKDTELEIAQSESQTGKVDEDYITGPKEIENYTLVGDSGDTTGKLTVEPITVIFYYLQNTKVTVQYIDKATDEILEEVTEPGLVGDSYTATSKDFENYVLVERPGKETVTMGKEEIVLKYYYAKVSGGVIEKHIDVVTGDILANEVHAGNEGDSYDIPSKIFEGYDLVEDKLPANAKGTMKVDTIEVTYYYHYRSRVVAEYVDKATGEKLVLDEVFDGHEGDDYTTEGKQIDDYRLIEVPENANGTMTKAPIKVTYYYVHLTGGVIERHIDIMTGEQLVVEEKFDGYEGDPYTTEPENIPYYDLVEDKYPANAEGTMTVEQIIVNYYYVRQTEVNVKYVDKVTGEEIEKTEIISGHEGDNYTTESKDIAGFDLIEIPENKDGKMTKEPLEVVYYYLRPAKVVVNHIDIETNQNLAEEVVINGHEGDSYVTESQEVKYYTLTKTPANAEGIMQVNIGKDEDGAEIVNDTTYVNYYYRKMEFNLKVDKTIGSVIVNGVEKQVNGNLGKVEIYRKELATTKVQVVYNIVVTNNSELSGKAKLLENIPDGMTMKPEKNTLWKISQTVAELETEDLKPGESKAYKVVLDWLGGENNTGTKKNMVQITGTENEAGYEEKDKQDNTDTADLIVTVGTGEYTYVAGVGITIIVLTAIVVTVVARKKKE